MNFLLVKTGQILMIYFKFYWLPFYVMIDRFNLFTNSIDWERYGSVSIYLFALYVSISFYVFTDYV